MRAALWCAVSSTAQTSEDKYSLPDQEEKQKALCAENNWLVTKTFIVPGHSRFYIDIHECAADMAAKGIYALTELIQTWKVKPRPFDVLVCRDFTRFARTASMLTYIVEMTLYMGAVVYSMTDGWVTEENSAIVVALAGFKTKKDITDLNQRRDAGLDSRLDRGLNMNNLPTSHRLVFDDQGKPSHLEINQKSVRFWMDVAELLLEGHSFRRITDEMVDRGHTTKSGHPVSISTFLRTLYNPYFWGHAARHYVMGRGKRHYDQWAFDENLPLPDGVKVHRNTHPAMYTGELADAVKAELRRRKEVIKGKAKPKGDYRYTGLLICNKCGSTLSANPNSGYPNWRCNARFLRYRTKQCPGDKSISDRKVTNEIRAFLKDWIGLGSPQNVPLFNKNFNVETQITLIESDILSKEEEIENMIDSQNAPGVSNNVRDLYSKKIHKAGQELDILKQQRKNLTLKSTNQAAESSRGAAFSFIVEQSVDAFLQQEPTVVNQTLHQLLIDLRFVFDGGEIVNVISKGNL